VLSQRPYGEAQNAIRLETTKAFKDKTANAVPWPSTHDNREMAARHLHDKFQFPGGMPEARRALSKTVLAPCLPRHNSGNYFKEETVLTVLRRGIPRFHRAVLEAATEGFLERAAVLLDVPLIGPKRNRRMTSANAQRCLDGHWLFADQFGREAMLSGLHRALARIKGLRGTMFEVGVTKRKIYKVRYGMYVSIVTKVRGDLFCSCPDLTSNMSRFL